MTPTTTTDVTADTTLDIIPGESTSRLVHEVVASGIDHLVLLMRHSAREFEPGRHDLLNPLTDEGRDLAKSLGNSLPKTLTLRGYTSPAERCVETADLILAGHAAASGDVKRNRVVEALGVFYVLDQMKMFMAMQEAGSLVNLLNDWFDRKIAADVLMPADNAARILGRLVAEKLNESPDSPHMDVMVSHDFTVYTLKALLLGQDTVRYPDVHFLDGIVFFKRDGKIMVQSHHEPATELAVD